MKEYNVKLTLDQIVLIGAIFDKLHEINPKDKGFATLNKKFMNLLLELKEDKNIEKEIIKIFVKSIMEEDDNEF